MEDCIFAKSVEKWGVFEAAVKGRTEGNPFSDYTIEGSFVSDSEEVTVNGFYDGEGSYKVRFMPSYAQTYHFSIQGSFSEEKFTGEFKVTEPTGNNHGPVKVRDKVKLVYEDGTPYQSFGTTCYVWALQNEELQKETLKTLENSPFNKIRFCVFPKHYLYNFHEPISYPYEGTPCKFSGENFVLFGEGAIPEGNHWNFTRFNTEHFTHLEECIEKLMALGIEADIILMHPYDRWGFSKMGLENENYYLKYVVSRFAAYRNIWWSMANEYDLFFHKPVENWEENAKVVSENDPYHHLNSIHNCFNFYDYSRPWITHCSAQRTELYRTTELTDELLNTYGKPVVWDEICYEGNINYAWGNISGEELTRRFWQAFLRGGHAGHGETYLGHEDILWWSHGGKLYGDSPARIKFLSDLLEEVPGKLLTYKKMEWDETVGKAVGMAGEAYYLHYYDRYRPSFRDFKLEEEKKYQVDVIDTWNMTIANAGTFSGKFRIDLPGKEFMAIRIKEIG